MEMNALQESRGNNTTRRNIPGITTHGVFSMQHPDTPPSGFPFYISSNYLPRGFLLFLRPLLRHPVFTLQIGLLSFSLAELVLDEKYCFVADEAHRVSSMLGHFLVHEERGTRWCTPVDGLLL